MIRKRTIIGTLLLLVILTASIYGFDKYFGIGGTGAACPEIFANLSFENATGFVAITHPDSQTTEFVLAPNTTGQLSVVYSSTYNDLTSSQFSGNVPAWKVDSSSSVQPSSSVTVIPISFRNEGNHTLVAQYSITAGTESALYLLGFPSTCRSVYLSV